ncbi:MAG: GtrA family protein [Candidatus Saccharibacteria bacterium]|nr:GtrA family protein [Candidatus Saccharibacteria bacterium]
MLKKLWALYKEYEEIINYVITGAFGTVVNVGTFTLARALNFDITISNVAAWVITIIFVYISSKFFVFKTANKTKRESTKEFITFVLARLATLGIEILLLNLTIEAMHMNELVAKTAAQVVVIILNYILSKLFVFTK